MQIIINQAGLVMGLDSDPEFENLAIPDGGKKLALPLGVTAEVFDTYADGKVIPRVSKAKLPTRSNFELALIEEGVIYDVDSFMASLATGLLPRDGALALLAYRSLKYDEPVDFDSPLFGDGCLAKVNMPKSRFVAIKAAAEKYAAEGG